MSQSDSTLTESKIQYSGIDRFCRSLFISFMSRLPEGMLVIKENGELVTRCGNDSNFIAEVNIIHPKVYRIFLIHGGIGAGESYTDGLWTSPDLTRVIRLFARNLPTLDNWESKLKWLSTPATKINHWLNRNSIKQAKKNISAHYDLGNKLYSKFLDESMMYSSAIYPDVNTDLANAQIHKLTTICEKLSLTSKDHLLEIGTGWGGLAIFAAKHYHCKVTTTTISEEQYQYANEWIQKEGLEDKITLLKKDYRALTGKFDKLVSIEMIEAVGENYIAGFFKRCNKLLKEDGVMLLQSIIIDDRRFEHYKNGVDFIQKHIFPGGFLPSQLVLNKSIKQHSNLSIRHLHDIGLDYAKTLKDWFNAFAQAKYALRKDGYDDNFIRMWEYYLKYCEGGFLERTISTVQLVLAKPKFGIAEAVE